MVAARILSRQDRIMAGMFLLDQDTLLVPVSSSASLIRIQRNPMVELGGFTPEYSRFEENCLFTISLQTENGRYPAPNDTQAGKRKGSIEQTFSLQIRYLIEEIDIDTYNIEIIPCLLYTSPSPRDLSTSRMPSSA